MNRFWLKNPTPSPEKLDRLKDECAVVGFISGCPNREVASFLERMLFALQNRGRQGSGISLYVVGLKLLLEAYKALFKEVFSNLQLKAKKQGLLKTAGDIIWFLMLSVRQMVKAPLSLSELIRDAASVTRKGRGSINEVFDNLFNRVVFHVATKVGIGHNRYKTAGKDTENELQPLTTRIGDDELAVVHNGNLTNAEELRRKLRKKGFRFKSTSDSEIVLHLIASHMKLGLTFEQALKKALGEIRGAFCYIFLWQGKLYVARDPSGFRPMSIGKLIQPDLGVSYIVASETAAFDLIKATRVRDVLPGEIAVLDGEKIETLDWKPAKKLSRCSLELFYFANLFSELFADEGDRLAVLPIEVRLQLGAQLALEDLAYGRPDVDIVLGVPNSGLPAARAYAKFISIDYADGIVRNPDYVKRTFMLDTQEAREKGAEEKYFFNPHLFRGKRVVVVDDSLVRGTTVTVITRKLFELGALEVHWRFAAPAIRYACHYGIDTPNTEELIAVDKDEEEIAAALEANSVRLISIEGVRKVIGSEGYCEACYTGEYPEAAGVPQLIQIAA
jgi:amidophosphoribosyltransferase